MVLVHTIALLLISVSAGAKGGYIKLFLESQQGRDEARYGPS